MTRNRSIRSKSSLSAVLVAASFMLALLPGSGLGASDPSGLWVTQTGGSTVRIAACGQGYCGRLVSTGGSGVDANNPDPALRGRRLAGIQILEARTPTAEGYEGSLYNPADGKTYSGRLAVQGPDTVEVAGCVLRVFCKRQTWRRVR